MRRRFGILLFALLASIGLAGGGRAQDAPANSAEQKAPELFERDAVCGPRCVQCVLKHYNGDAPELITLVRQIQWPKLSEGSSLGDLQQAVESYGIQTKAVQVPDGNVPVLDHPCICHFRAQGASMGHFVVLLPGTTRTTALIWDNGRTWECPSWEMTERCSGAFLVTAPRGGEAPNGTIMWTIDAIVARAGYYGIFLLLSLVGARLAIEFFPRGSKKV
jgi:ABC-type bacteriocin/lantibiotic exporter with double-glycine peptidase domain